MVSLIERILYKTIYLFPLKGWAFWYRHASTLYWAKIIQTYGITLVLDVGANQGQFATLLRSLGYRGRIISFEPFSTAHTALERCAHSDANWHVHARCALGSSTQETILHIAANEGLSSSVLPMCETHEKAAPHARYVGQEKVNMTTLDQAALPYCAGEPMLLKIDTQGYEKDILASGAQVLSRAKLVFIELSLTELYAGQALWQEMIALLEAAGFFVVHLHPGFTCPDTGRLLQLDGLFARKDG